MFQKLQKHCITPKPNIHDQHKHPTSSARRSPRLGIKNCLFSIINTAGFAIPTHPTFYYQHGRFCITSPSCFLLSTWQVLQYQPILLRRVLSTLFDEFASFRKPLLLCKVTYTEGKKKCQFLNKRNYVLQES
jgi:hypothetical protein